MLNIGRASVGSSENWLQPWTYLDVQVPLPCCWWPACLSKRFSNILVKPSFLNVGEHIPQLSHFGLLQWPFGKFVQMVLRSSPHRCCDYTIMRATTLADRWQCKYHDEGLTTVAKFSFKFGVNLLGGRNTIVFLVTVTFQLAICHSKHIA